MLQRSQRNTSLHSDDSEVFVIIIIIIVIIIIGIGITIIISLSLEKPFKKRGQTCAPQMSHCEFAKERQDTRKRQTDVGSLSS